MKSKWPYILLLLVLIGFIAFLAIEESHNPITHITVVGCEAVTLGSFDEADYTLQLKMADQSIRSVSFSSLYINEEDRAKLNTIGTHTIHFTYRGISGEFSITIHPKPFEMLTFSSATYLYDGTPKSINVQGFPEGARVTYDQANVQTKAGEYVICATVSMPDYITTSLSATLVILPAKVEKPEPNSAPFTYTGKAQTYPIATSPYYSITGETQTNAGEYTAKVSLSDKDNYQWDDGTTDDLFFPFSIGKATYNMSGVTLSDYTTLYDGSTKVLTISGALPDGVTVTYQNNTRKDVGEVRAVASFAGDSINYHPIPSLTATLRIMPANFDGVTFASQTFMYDGKEKSISIEGILPDGISVSYQGNAAKQVGSYKVTASFSGTNPNYTIIPSLVAYITIVPYVVECPSASLATFVYNGTPQTYPIADSPYYSITQQTRTYAGTQFVNVALCDKTNYCWSTGGTDDLTFPFTIAKRELEVDVPSYVLLAYTGLPQKTISAKATNLVGDDEVAFVVTYSGDMIDPDTYLATISLVPHAQYQLTTSLVVTVEIVRTLHKVTFLQEGAPNVVISVPHLSAVNPPPPLQNMPGYTFAWEAIDLSSVTEDITVHAIKTATLYTITYHLNGCENQPSNPTTFTIENLPIYLEPPVKAGANHTAWWADGQVITSITSIGNITMEAHYDNGTEGLVYSQTEEGYIVEGYHGSAESVNIPYFHQDDFVVGIAPRAFMGNTTVCEVKIPYTITFIGSFAFANCPMIESFTVDSRNETYESLAGHLYADAGKTLLQYAPSSDATTFEVGAEVTHIAGYAFSYASNLLALTLPDSVSKMGEKVFTNTPYLSIYAEPARKPLGWHSEWNASGCDVVWAYRNITTNPDFDYVIHGAEAGLTKYKGSAKAIEIPSTIDGYRVVRFGDIFAQNESLSAVSVPDSIQYIADFAFFECSNLVRVVLPMQLTHIGEQAFFRCCNLTSLSIGEEMKEIGEMAFDGCYKLVEVINFSQLQIEAGSSEHGYVAYYAMVVHKDSTHIVNQNEFLFIDGKDGTHYLIGYLGYASQIVLPQAYNGASYNIYPYAFYQNQSIVSVVMPDTVVELGDAAFYECHSLVSLHLGQGLISIGEYAFYACDALTIIDIPDSVKAIGEYAFYGNLHLVSVRLGSGLNEIGSLSFYACPMLMEVINHSALNIEKGSEMHGYVGYYAMDVHRATRKIAIMEDFLFYTDTNGIHYLMSYQGKRNELTLPAHFNGQTYRIYPYAFHGQDSITTVTIPDGVTSVGDFAFYGCQSLLSVEMGDHVAYIGESAFQECAKLAYINLSANTAHIGEYAFAGCKNLARIYIPATVTYMGAGAFGYCNKLTIYCAAPSALSSWHTLWNMSERRVVWGYTQ